MGDVFQERDRLRSRFALCEADKERMMKLILKERQNGRKDEGQEGEGQGLLKPERNEGPADKPLKPFNWR